MIIVKDVKPRVFEYKFELGRNVLVTNGEKVKIGQKLVEGYINLGRLMQVAGTLTSQQYIVNEIKAIYSSQGQTVNSKHIELVVRQMFSRVRVLDKGDTEFFPGDIVDIIRFKKENDILISDHKKA